eukprot:scaffold196_cov371-Prasinococcus_capsulatus_cf.AAC.15
MCVYEALGVSLALHVCSRRPPAHSSAFESCASTADDDNNARPSPTKLQRQKVPLLPTPVQLRRRPRLRRPALTILARMEAVKRSEVYPLTRNWQRLVPPHSS